MPNIKNPALRERNSKLFFGCSEIEAIRLNGEVPLRTSGSYAQRYLYQRQAAFKRGIAWDITFPNWLAIWQDSGKWNLRGRGKGCFCMARYGDIGPYKVGNVSIQLCSENSRDGIKKAHLAMRLNPSILCMGIQVGSGRGWTFRNGKRNPYQVCVGKKYIGLFATQQVAEQAYQIASEIHRTKSFC